MNLRLILSLETLVHSYDDLILFAKIVDYKTYTQAAKILNIGQSTISRRIKLLEEGLGIKLFFQDGRNISLTEDGRLLYRKLEEQKASFIELDNFIYNLAFSKNEARGTVKAVFPSGLAQYFITKHLPEFLLKYPQINLHVKYHSEKIDLVKEDIDIVVSNQIPEQLDQKYKRVYSTTVKLYCSKKYKEKYGLPKTPEDLKDHQVVTFIRENNSVIQKINFLNPDNGKVVTINVSDRFAINNVVNGVIILQSNEFITALNDAIAAQVEDIVEVFPEYIIDDLSTKFYLMTHPHKNLIAIRLFSDFLVEKLKV